MALPALAGPALVAGSHLLTHFAPQKEVSGGPQNNGYMQGDGFLATAGTSLAGGVAGAALRRSDLGPDASPREKIGATVMGGALGVGSGLLANMQNDAIQGEGGSIKSAIFGAGSAMLASKLKDGGPNLLQSAIIGGGSGLTANILHDKATDKGYGMQADLGAGALQGGALGYTGMGDLKGTGIGAALGGAAGFASNKLTEQQGIGAGLSVEQQELMQSEGANNAVDAQNPFKADSMYEQPAQTVQANHTGRMADQFMAEAPTTANEQTSFAPQKEDEGPQMA